MTSVDRLRGTSQVMYHQSCPDGTVSAMIVYDALRLLLGDDGVQKVDFKSVQYNTNFFENVLQPRHGHLFVDITPPRSRWEDWRPFNPIVLDHHESVKDLVEALGGVYATNEAHSGARLAFEHVLVPVVEHLRKEVTAGSGVTLAECDAAIERWDEVSRIAMVRDTWKDDHEDFERASIQAYGLMTLGSKEMLSQMRENRLDMGLVMKLGEVDYGKAKFMAQGSRRYDLECPALGRTLAAHVYNCTDKKYISDGCHHLLRDGGADIAISYFYKTDESGTQAIVSLRTNDPIASTIAKRMGGGGHDRAAGFGIRNAERVSMEDIVDAVRKQLLELPAGSDRSQ